MGKTSKDKRDIYYRLAKEEGWRARSAFKLLQIDERFQILSRIRPDNKEIRDPLCRVVDLCAAPGSWSQVLAKRLWESRSPENRDVVKILAVDLQEISPIPGIDIIQGDITKQSTADQILSAFIGGNKAELVICDGAPDVTGLHDIDEYIQHQLILAALNITTCVLEPEGTFLAKMFRGRNSDLLSLQLRCFFTDVLVAKPRSSRQSSQEAFILCRGFHLPAGFVPRLDSPMLMSREVVSEAQVDCEDPLERYLIPFVTCGDLSGFDSDATCAEVTSAGPSLPPVQSPIAPPYAEALQIKRSLHIQSS